jgi:omega-amidase
MQIVAVQLDIAWEDKPANHRRVAQLLQENPPQPGSLIILPEMFDTGFSMNLGATAQTDRRESEAVLRQLASQYESTVLGGVVGCAVNGQASNLAVAFSPSGQELVRYQKQRPFTLTREQENYPAGRGEKFFQLDGVSIAPFVCYDLRFPELFRPAALSGAELLVVIACWPAVRSEHWVRLLQARSIENQAYVVGVNRCGSEPGLPFDGRSCAFDHMGKQLFQAGPEPQVLMATLDLEALRAWRRKFPALCDAKTYL